MKKKILMLLMSLIMMTMVMSCTTNTVDVVEPYLASVSFPSEGQYKILGRVDFETSKGKSGFKDFLEYAKSVYPETDDVVNIIVDSDNTYQVSTGYTAKTTRTLKSSVYMMSGIAIQYIEQ